jgi:hypothetical protein
MPNIGITVNDADYLCAQSLSESGYGAVATVLGDAVKIGMRELRDNRKTDLVIQKMSLKPEIGRLIDRIPAEHQAEAIHFLERLVDAPTH